MRNGQKYFKNTCEVVDILVLCMVRFTILFRDYTILPIMLSDVYFHFI